MTSSSSGWVNLVVAMSSEARPLSAHRQLAPMRQEEPFRWYQGDGLRLVISGIGKEAAAAAAGFLFSQSGATRDQGWLNLGIGGHEHLPLGSIALGHKIVDLASSRAWYPPRVHEVPCPPSEIHTVDAVERRYDAPAVYEMEAAGFVAACGRFAIAEQVQVVKIVSDNLASPPDRITRDRIGEWIAAQLPVIDTVVESLGAIASTLAERRSEPRLLERFDDRWHFTVTERHELRDLLRRWQLCLPETDPWPEVEASTAAGEVLAVLRARLASTLPRLGGRP